MQLHYPLEFSPIIIPKDNIATDMITFTNKDLVFIISFLFNSPLNN